MARRDLASFSAPRRATARCAFRAVRTAIVVPAFALASCASTSLYGDTFGTRSGAARYVPSHEPTTADAPDRFVSGRSLPDPQLGRVAQYWVLAPFALAWDVVSAPVQIVLGYPPF